MNSDEEVKFRQATLNKFKDEQNRQLGGSKSPLLGSVLGVGAYVACGRWPLQVEKVPYRMMFATVGYGLGIVLGSKIFGDKHHFVYYTQREKDVLVSHLGNQWVTRLKVIDESTPVEEGNN